MGQMVKKYLVVKFFMGLFYKKDTAWLKGDNDMGTWTSISRWSDEN